MKSFVLKYWDNSDIQFIHKKFFRQRTNDIISMDGGPHIHVCKPEMCCLHLIDCTVPKEVDRENIRICL